MDDYIFSIAKHKDVPEIKAVNESCLKENYPLEMYDKLVDDILMCKCRITGKIVGYIIITNLATNADATANDKILIPYSRKYKNNLIHTTIISLAVLSEYRGLGIGSKLLRIAIGSHKKHPIILHVRKSNESAISIYKKIGFKVLAEIREYYQDPAEDGYIMLLTSRK